MYDQYNSNNYSSQTSYNGLRYDPTKEYYSQVSEDLKRTAISQDQLQYYQRKLDESEILADQALKKSKGAFICGLIYCCVPLCVFLTTFFLRFNIPSGLDYILIGLYFISGIFFLPALIKAIKGLTRSRFCKPKFKSKVRSRCICTFILIGITIMFNFIYSFAIIKSAVNILNETAEKYSMSENYGESYNEKGYNTQDPHYQAPNFRKEYN